MANGQLASEYMCMSLPMQVLHSAAGFYIGTSCPDEGPVSRESAEFYPTREAAQNALDTDTFTQRDYP